MGRRPPNPTPPLIGHKYPSLTDLIRERERTDRDHRIIVLPNDMRIVTVNEARAAMGYRPLPAPGELTTMHDLPPILVTFAGLLAGGFLAWLMTMVVEMLR